MSDTNKKANDASGGRGDDNRPGGDQLLQVKSSDIAQDVFGAALRAAPSK